jgi:hypothetical protein
MWLVLAWLALRFAPPRWFLPPHTRTLGPAGTGVDPPRARALAAAVTRAARRVPGGSSCLVEALALAWMVRRRRLRARVRIGVARSGGRLLAHAWVEAPGLPGPRRARWRTLEG